MLRLLPLSLSAQCRSGGPPSHRCFVDGGSPSQRTGPGLLANNGVRVRVRRRALRGADVQPDTPPSRRDGDKPLHADAEQVEGSGGELLDSVRKLLLKDAEPGEEEQGRPWENGERQGDARGRWGSDQIFFLSLILYTRTPC